jgi:hypothetical protein
MSIREVTFEELLTILRSPPGKTAMPPKKPDRYNVDDVRGPRFEFSQQQNLAPKECA